MALEDLDSSPICLTLLVRSWSKRIKREDMGGLLGFSVATYHKYCLSSLVGTTSISVLSLASGRNAREVRNWRLNKSSD